MPTKANRGWVNTALRKIEADFARSADTHLIPVPLPALDEITLYLKDESTHPTGSLKHRLARSLFLYGICNGWIHEATTIVEASSGSTAVSEAYFARLLDLPFIAVMPRTTSKEKIEKITFYGGKCHLVDAADIYSESAQLATQMNGHYMDQFTYAERVTDWRGNNNIAMSIFEQMKNEPHPIPAWVVMSAGTGGTSATIGRYIRYKRLDTRLCVADPSNSVFYEYYTDTSKMPVSDKSSNIEGIGRPRVEPSFQPSVIDKMIKVDDAAAIASIHFLERLLDRKCGGSTGTNLYAACQIASEMRAENRQGSIVSLICDSGDRYLDTYYNPAWLRERGFDTGPYAQKLEAFYDKGVLEP